VFDGYTDDPPSLTIIWSILTFGQMLSVIVMKSYRREQYFNIEQWPDSVVLDRRLAKRKWCPNFIARLKTTLTMDTLYFLSLMPWQMSNNPYASVERFFISRDRRKSAPAALIMKESTPELQIRPQSRSVARTRFWNGPSTTISRSMRPSLPALRLDRHEWCCAQQTGRCH
jgi:hypothetical protein